jgi:TPR repeat protein
MIGYNTVLVRQLYAKSWENNKDFAPLIAYLDPFVEAGYIRAYVELARVEGARGDIDRSNDLVDQAEKLLRPEDLEGRVELWSAYREGLGKGTQQQKDAKALNLIAEVAASGNVPAQEILMMDYLEGTNGVQKDPERFHSWAKRAAKGGSVLAAEELKKFARSHRLEKPSST